MFSAVLFVCFLPNMWWYIRILRYFRTDCFCFALFSTENRLASHLRTIQDNALQRWFRCSGLSPENLKDGAAAAGGRGGKGRHWGQHLARRDAIHNVRQWSLRAMQLRRRSNKPAGAENQKSPMSPLNFLLYSRSLLLPEPKSNQTACDTKHG